MIYGKWSKANEIKGVFTVSNLGENLYVHNDLIIELS